MNEVITLGEYRFSKDLLIAIIIFFLVITIVLAKFYYSDSNVLFRENNKSNQSRGDEGDMEILPNQPSLQVQNEKSNNDYLKLAFCPNECAVINAETQEVIAKFHAGSQNCRLMTYLFRHPNKTHDEYDIAFKVNPTKPESFYIRKAICNLKLDKDLRSKMFTIHGAKKVTLNTLIPIPADVA
ncbi:hypothetical protein VHA01S_030_00310 [Vibrio halioticoli NBRC 102217]|uniref:Uncharacterized protein n=1 Tax=Vibrio halioticoli NBRC 102217 TaxID=1219072 RepID=V5FJM7_9VIBR|nr:hypothetical protein [Vibrio halioticoli]GAD89956.1 hypothetical protein VHA01S_030_00310 [Vibrio halioticoli NBRC 102217]